MGFFALNNEVKLDTIIKRRSDLLFNEIDGELVMLSIENSEYYGMDKVGSRIWDLLEQPLCLKDLVVVLMNEYNVTEEQCIKDTSAFINKLWDKKLIINY